MRYIVVFQNASTVSQILVPPGEARFWAFLSVNAFNCNVYEAAGAPLPLCPTDIALAK